MSDVGNVEEMAQHTIYILSDDVRLLQFKTNALNRAKEFDINNVAPIYEKYYDKVIFEK